MGTEACNLPYPDRFNAAVDYINRLPNKGRGVLSSDTQLLLYSLHQQATVGPCTESKPWGWNMVEAAKWQSWKQLGNMNSMEAMRLYVRSLEEEQADWYARALASQTGDAAGEEAAGDSSSVVPQVADSPPSEWVTLEAEGAKKPLPRYEHGAAVLGRLLYVVGGNYAGRYLGDLWTFDINTHTWAQPPMTTTEAPLAEGEAAPTVSGLSFGPCAGHTLTAVNQKLYVVGGHAKGPRKPAADLTVHVLDLKYMSSSLVTTSGTTPVGRGSHTTTLVAHKLYVIAGEDSMRRPLSDLAVLDLVTLEWSAPETTGKAPSARAAHVAVAYQDRYIVVFGGGSVATCLADIFVLDTHTLAWSTPAVEGVAVTARAGHSGAVLGNTMYVLGGGNNVKGCTEMLALELSDLPSGRVKWSVVTAIPARDPLSSEGISLMALPDAQALVAFGGYNGKYHNAVSVFRTAPPSAAKPQKPEAKAAAAAAAETPHVAKTSSLETSSSIKEKVNSEKVLSRTHSTSGGGSMNGSLTESQAAAAREALAAREVAAAVAAKEAAAHELVLMRRQLASAQAAVAEREKAVEEGRGALHREQAKVLKLEVEIAEMRQRLEAMAELEREVEKWRKVAKEAEAKGSRGIWGYIAGS